MARRKKHVYPPGERYVGLQHHMLESKAFGALSGNAVKLLIKIAQRHNGYNNGKISFSVREAADVVGCAKNTAANLFRELERKGFLENTERGGFNRKNRHASTWRVTFLPSRDGNGDLKQGDRPYMTWPRSRPKLIRLPKAVSTRPKLKRGRRSCDSQTQKLQQCGRKC